MREGMTQVQVRIPVTVHQALKEEAKRQERSVNWIISKALQAALHCKEQQQEVKQ